MKIYDNILETIGNTPLVKLNKVTKGIKATVLAKVETTNPGNSVKDRMAVKMIDDAEKAGLLKPGGTMLVYSSFPRVATLMGVQGTAYQAFLNLMGKPFKNGPVRYYSHKEVVRLYSGFSEVKFVPYGFSVLPKTLIFLPGFLEKLYRLGIANPVNKLLERVFPVSGKDLFAVHFDVVAKR